MKTRHRQIEAFPGSALERMNDVKCNAVKKKVNEMQAALTVRTAQMGGQMIDVYSGDQVALLLLLSEFDASLHVWWEAPSPKRVMI